MRRDLVPLLVLAALLVGGVLGYRWVFSGEATLVLLAVEGRVERTDAFGAPRSIEVGTELRERDRVVAGEGGRAVLALGDDTRLTLEGDSSVKLLGVDARGVRLELEEGRVQATVRRGSPRVGIVAGGREFTADDADFTAARARDGTLGVEARRGEVAVSGVDGVDRVGPREILVLPDRGDPLVQPLGDALLLFVAEPTAARVREESATVHGRTLPGARVLVRTASASIEVKAREDGTWSTTVPLIEGTNDVAVTATDLFGRTAESSVAVVRDTQAPAVGVQLRY